jgi:hypothetical protein
VSDQEFEYALETRYRLNLVDEENRVRPDPPNWGEWTPWHVSRIYHTLAGAAMAHSQAYAGVQYTYGTPKAATHEYDRRIAYRKVTKVWTPLLPALDEEEE